MLKRILPWLLAMIVLVGIWALVTPSVMKTAFDNAEIARDTCYANHGFQQLGLGDIPDAVRNECTKSIVDYEASAWYYHLLGIGAGLIAALIVLGIFYLATRRKADAAPS